MNDALEMCADVGFEMAPGFSTHWAMGSEALITLGHPERVHDWVALYLVKVKHLPKPALTQKIDAGDESDWRSALGDWSRASDWQQLFEEELGEHPWREVIVTWWPRLISGVGAGLTHGLIRTMHAVRGIDRGGEPVSELHLRELATALGYWAGKYVEQPGPTSLSGDTRLPDLISEIPRLAPDSKLGLMEKGRFRPVWAIPGWAEAVTSLHPPEDIQAGLSDITSSLAQVQLVHPDIFPIPLVHTITAPAAMRVMLQYVPDEYHAASFAAMWKTVGALLSAFAPDPKPEEIALAVDSEQPALAPQELGERAVENGDQHALKLAEAAIREYTARPDPRYLLLTERLFGKLPRYYPAAKAAAS
jgi:hypothetical protein